MSEMIGLILITLGALFVLVAGIGILRLLDLYLRMSATTKAATLGLGILLIGVTFIFGTWGVTGRVIVTLFFVLLTAPIAAQAIGQAAYYAGIPLWSGTKDDELRKQAARHKKRTVATAR